MFGHDFILVVLVVVITCLATARLDLYLLSNLDVGADERCGHVAQTLTKNLDGSVTQAIGVLVGLSALAEGPMDSRSCVRASVRDAISGDPRIRFF